MTNAEFERSQPEIPLEARLSFIDRAQSHTAWMGARAIAETIGANERWVYRVVKELGINPELVSKDGVEVSAYPPWATDILREELQWREYVRDLPSELGVGDIAESLGRSWGWTRSKLEEAGLSPIRKSGPMRYSKRALKELRRMSMSVPLDDGWYNLRQLVELSGQDREWIERRISEAGYEPVERRSAITGRVYDYFPPEALGVITGAQAERAKPAGDWLTAYRIAKCIDRNEKWVNSRLGPYEELAQILQDDMGVARVHYPPLVLAELEAESERLRQLPERGDYLNIHQVARRAGHGTDWALKRIESIGIEPGLRVDGKGRAQLYYPPSTVQLLIDYDSSHEVSHERAAVVSGRIWEARVAVGSLRSQIRLKRKIDSQLKQRGGVG